MMAIVRMNGLEIITIVIRIINNHHITFIYTHLPSVCKEKNICSLLLLLLFLDSQIGRGKKNRTHELYKDKFLRSNHHHHHRSSE